MHKDLKYREDLKMTGYGVLQQKKGKSNVYTKKEYTISIV